jgi:hypothetical protein
MLWSGDDDFVRIAVADGEHPCPAALADDGPGLSVEAAVRHAFLDAGFNDNVNPVPDLELLDNRGYRREPALSQIFLELIPCFLSWTIVVCHDLFSLRNSFYLRNVEAGDVSALFQDLGKTWDGSAFVPGYEFFDVEAGFAEDFNNKFSVLLPHALDIKDLSLPDFICSPVGDPYGRALLYYDAF